ncbi:hypothetical protein CC78DRAFT_587143 [Lojkania enalia]|uniref:Uncharacterized protein n=1 Tax=Lojkania enalia TaxID=147567 RepID=A0A9P4K0H9_9PLEO|nr:hypothetical protein CC78DRAFT_587143 [Didymosphaeria enalia]
MSTLWVSLSAQIPRSKTPTRQQKSPGTITEVGIYCVTALSEVAPLPSKWIYLHLSAPTERIVFGSFFDMRARLHPSHIPDHAVHPSLFAAVISNVQLEAFIHPQLEQLVGTIPNSLPVCVLIFHIRSKHSEIEPVEREKLAQIHEIILDYARFYVLIEEDGCLLRNLQADEGLRRFLLSYPFTVFLANHIDYSSQPYRYTVSRNSGGSLTRSIFANSKQSSLAY